MEKKEESKKGTEKKRKKQEGGEKLEPARGGGGESPGVGPEPAKDTPLSWRWPGFDSTKNDQKRG